MFSTLEKVFSNFTSDSPLNSVNYLFKSTGYTPQRLLLISPLSTKVSKSLVPPGRTALHKKFLEIPNKVENVIQTGGLKAAPKRDSESGICAGAPVKVIHKNVSETAYGLKKISHSSVRRVCEAPNKSRKASKHYHGAVRAKIPRVRNDLHPSYKDDHAYRSRVRLTREFSTHFYDSVLSLSCDNKCKVFVGSNAVDRRLRTRRIYNVNDPPRSESHDLPLGKDYKFTPSGVMVLEPSKSQPRVMDEFGRISYNPLPCAGPIYVFNRAQAFFGATIESHFEDLTEVLAKEGKGKKILTLILDNGSDWNWNSVGNLLYMSRLFKQENLDALLCCSYAPGQSAWNPIEHAWAPLTTAIINDVYPAILSSEKLIPTKQGISKAEQMIKLGKVMDTAMGMCAERWHMTSFKEYPYTVINVPCAQATQNYVNLKKTLKKPTAIKKSENLMEEFNFMVMHLDRRIDSIRFTKCNSVQCAHCYANPPSDSSAFQFLKQHPSFPEPVQNHLNLVGRHFYRFLDYVSGSLVENSDCRCEAFRVKLAALKFALKSDVVYCSVCKNYMFTSDADRKRHNSVFHRKGSRAKKRRVAKKKSKVTEVNI